MVLQLVMSPRHFAICVIHIKIFSFCRKQGQARIHCRIMEALIRRQIQVEYLKCFQNVSEGALNEIQRFLKWPQRCRILANDSCSALCNTHAPSSSHDIIEHLPTLALAMWTELSFGSYLIYGFHMSHNTSSKWRICWLSRITSVYGGLNPQRLDRRVDGRRGKNWCD